MKPMRAILSLFARRGKTVAAVRVPCYNDVRTDGSGNRRRTRLLPKSDNHRVWLLPRQKLSDPQASLVIHLVNKVFDKTANLAARRTFGIGPKAALLVRRVPDWMRENTLDPASRRAWQEELVVKLRERQ